MFWSVAHHKPRAVQTLRYVGMCCCLLPHLKYLMGSPTGAMVVMPGCRTSAAAAAYECPLLLTLVSCRSRLASSPSWLVLAELVASLSGRSQTCISSRHSHQACSFSSSGLVGQVTRHGRLRCYVQVCSK